MKCISYSLTFTLPNNETEVYNNLNMKDLIEKSSELVQKHYNTTIPITRNVIYNIYRRPQLSNRILREWISII